MYVCTHCAASVDLSQHGEGRTTCPGCGAPAPPQGERAWTDVARVRNLAEAGFLSDELIGLGIDARIHQLEEFGAVNHRWASLYLIRVPAGAEREAAARIREHLSEEEPQSDPERGAFRFTIDDHSADPLLWRPVAIVILAGMASFVLGQRFSEQKQHKAERRPPRNSLASAVEEIGRPLVSESAVGKPRHRLSFDRRRQAWFLDVDRDGDGHYDGRRAFHFSGAAW
jgi:hypothetical protein